jgi:hypothetical protein
MDLFGPEVFAFVTQIWHLKGKFPWWVPMEARLDQFELRKANQGWLLFGTPLCWGRLLAGVWRSELDAIFMYCLCQDCVSGICTTVGIRVYRCIFVYLVTAGKVLLWVELPSVCLQGVRKSVPKVTVGVIPVTRQGLDFLCGTPLVWDPN